MACPNTFVAQIIIAILSEPKSALSFRNPVANLKVSWGLFFDQYESDLSPTYTGRKYSNEGGVQVRQSIGSI